MGGTDCDETQDLDALKLSKSAPTALRKYKGLEDLAILNEQAVFTIIYDFSEEGNPKKLWANAAWLQYVGESLEEFQSYDFAGNTSAHIKKQMYELGQEIQVKKKTVSFEHTAYPKEKPVRVLLVQRPIMFEDLEHALILVHYFNGDNSVVDKTAAGDPLNFQFHGEVCARTHSMPGGLELLDEVACHALVFDFSQHNQPQKLWANAAWLNLVDQSLEDFQGSEFVGCSTALSSEQMFAIGQDVQVKRKVVSFETTLFPRNKPLRVLCVFRPLLLEGWGYPVVLANFTPPQPHNGLLGNRDFILYKEQVLSLLAQGVIFFNSERGSETYEEALWANFSARAAYGITYDSTSLLTSHNTVLDLEYVLGSCDWSLASQRDSIFKRLRSLELDSQPVEFTCRKHASGSPMSAESADDHQERWHKFTFRRCKNPYTGRDTLLLQEADVSKLMHAQAELQESNDLKDRFLHCVSHELRTPIHGILGLCNSLLASDACDPLTHRTLLTVEDSARRLSVLVEDILEMTACMAGSLRLDRVPLNLSQLVGTVCNTLQPRLRKGVRLENRVEEGDFKARGDAVRIRRVLMHLLDNAVKFTARGSIVVSAEHLPDAVRILVTDSGVGVDEAELCRIWDHFRQGDMSAARRHGGTGLGLALVKRLVTAHGGVVDVSSVCQHREGSSPSGSCFSFTLPIDAADGGSDKGERRGRGAEGFAQRHSIASSHLDKLRSASSEMEPRTSAAEINLAARVEALEAMLLERDGAAIELEVKVEALEERVRQGTTEAARLEGALAQERRVSSQLRRVEERLMLANRRLEERAAAAERRANQLREQEAATCKVMECMTHEVRERGAQMGLLERRLHEQHSRTQQLERQLGHGRGDRRRGADGRGETEGGQEAPDLSRAHGDCFTAALPHRDQHEDRVLSEAGAEESWLGHVVQALASSDGESDTLSTASASSMPPAHAATKRSGSWGRDHERCPWPLSAASSPAASPAQAPSAPSARPCSLGRTADDGGEGGREGTGLDGQALHFVVLDGSESQWKRQVDRYAGGRGTEHAPRRADASERQRHPPSELQQRREGGDASEPRATDAAVSAACSAGRPLAASLHTAPASAAAYPPAPGRHASTAGARPAPAAPTPPGHSAAPPFELLHRGALARAIDTGRQSPRRAHSEGGAASTAAPSAARSGARSKVYSGRQGGSGQRTPALVSDGDSADRLRMPGA